MLIQHPIPTLNDFTKHLIQSDSNPMITTHKNDIRLDTPQLNEPNAVPTKDQKPSATILLSLSFIDRQGTTPSHLISSFLTATNNLLMTNLQLLLIPAHHPIINTNLPKNIHIRTREFPRTHPPLKQEIQLRKTASLRFRHPEIRIDDTAEADRRPEEARVVAPVPGPRVQHVRRQDGADDADDVVEIAAQDHGLDLQAAGRQFGDEGVADCSDGKLVEHGPDEHYGAGGEGSFFFVGVGDETEEAEDEEHGAETAEAVEVEGSTTDAHGHEEPGSEDSDHVDAVLTESEVVGCGCWETGLFEEVG